MALVGYTPVRIRKSSENYTKLVVIECLKWSGVSCFQFIPPKIAESIADSFRSHQKHGFQIAMGLPNKVFDGLGIFDMLA